MNKVDLAGLVFQKIEGINGTKKLAGEIVDTIFDKIADALRGGQEVAVAGFGTFRVKDRKARQARNPRTGAMVSVPASKAVKFRVAKALKESVK
jgi:DNA-binding protein HU-beta